MFEFRHDLIVKFPFGICLLCAPSAAAFGQDGQIILGVFVPIIVIVIVVLIVRLCWEWRMERHQDPYTENVVHSFIQSQTERIIEAPKNLGNVVYGNSFPCQGLQNSNRFLFNGNNCKYNKDAVYSPFFVSPPNIRPSKQMQRRMIRRSRKRRLSTRKMWANYNHHTGGRRSKRFVEEAFAQQQQNFARYRMGSLRKERPVLRSGSIKSTDMEVWLENKRCSRNERSRKSFTDELGMKYRKRVIKGSTGSTTSPGRVTKRASIRNNMRASRRQPNAPITQIDKRNDVNSGFGMARKNSENKFERDRKVVNLYANRNRFEGNSFKTRSTARLNTRMCKTNGSKTLKSCLKRTQTRGLSAKRVRFKPNAIRKPRRRIHSEKPNKVLILKRPGKKRVLISKNCISNLDDRINNDKAYNFGNSIFGAQTQTGEQSWTRESRHNPFREFHNKSLLPTTSSSLPVCVIPTHAPKCKNVQNCGNKGFYTKSNTSLLEQDSFDRDLSQQPSSSLIDSSTDYNRINSNTQPLDVRNCLHHIIEGKTRNCIQNYVSSLQKERDKEMRVFCTEESLSIVPCADYYSIDFQDTTECYRQS